MGSFAGMGVLEIVKAGFDIEGSLWLVTGASRGIGRAIALELAPRGVRLVLAGRDLDALDDTSRAVRAAGAQDTLVLTGDLTDPDVPARLLAETRDRMGNPDGLVNNAGFSGSGDVVDASEEEIRGQIAVNIQAVMKLTHACAASMVESGRGWILNVGSMAGFQPTPTHAVYGATKAWVVSFSCALHQELRQHNVHVTGLCPGLTRTEFFGSNKVDTSRRFGRYGSWMDPEPCARHGVEAVLRNRMIAVPGFTNRTLSGMQKFLPRRVVAALADRMVR